MSEHRMKLVGYIYCDTNSRYSYGDSGCEQMKLTYSREELRRMRLDLGDRAFNEMYEDPATPTRPVGGAKKNMPQKEK